MSYYIKANHIAGQIIISAVNEDIGYESIQATIALDCDTSITAKSNQNTVFLVGDNGEQYHLYFPIVRAFDAGVEQSITDLSALEAWALGHKSTACSSSEASVDLFLGDFATVGEMEAQIDVPDGTMATVTTGGVSSLYIYNEDLDEWTVLTITNLITNVDLGDPIDAKDSFVDGEYLIGFDTMNNVKKYPQAFFSPTDIKVDLTPAGQGTFRVRSQSVLPGWAYTVVGGGSTAYQVVDVEPDSVYTFEGCTHTFDTLNSFIFLTEQEDAFQQYLGAATDDIITPKDCKKVVFSVPNASRGAGFKFVKKLNQTTEKTTRTGANLADGVYYTGWLPLEDTGTFGFAVQSGGIISSSIPVREGATYYYYRTVAINGILPVAVGLDADDNCVALISSEFSGYAVPDHYVPITIPEGLGITKIMLIISRSTNDETDFLAGDLKYALVEEANYRIIEDFKEPARALTFAEAVNEIVDLRAPIKKTFSDKNLMIVGDSVYATQTDAKNAYFVNNAVTPNSQGTNKLYGGASAEVVRRLRPATWTNYSNGGWTLTYDGPYFGQAIYDNAQAGNYLYLLERFFVDYDNYVADPVTYASAPRYAPDIFMVASCINDFSNPTEAWVTDAEVAGSGKSYDQYMEDTFVSSGAANDTLIPLENINLNKIAGALRYIIERVYRKFPKCYIVVITSNKTSNHSRESQMKCTRDMIWMAERLNVQVIDLFHKGNQLIPLKEFKADGTGTRDELYLTLDGIHSYGSTGNGDQRQGRFITNELIKGYFDLSDFL